MKSTIPKNILLCALFLFAGLQLTMAQKTELPREKQTLLASGKKTTTFFYDETAGKLTYDGKSWPSEHAERVFTRLPEAGDTPSMRVSAEPPRSIILRQGSYSKSARWWFSNFKNAPKKENGIEAYEFQVTFTIRDHFSEDTKYPLQFHIGNSPKGYWYLYVKNDGQLEVGSNGAHTGNKWKDLYYIKKSNRVKPFKQHTLRFVWFSDGTYYLEFDHYKKYSMAHKDEDSRTLPFIGLSNRVNFNTLVDLHRVVVQQVKNTSDMQATITKKAKNSSVFVKSSEVHAQPKGASSSYDEGFFPVRPIIALNKDKSVKGAGWMLHFIETDKEKTSYPWMGNLKYRGKGLSIKNARDLLSVIENDLKIPKSKKFQGILIKSDWHIRQFHPSVVKKWQNTEMSKKEYQPSKNEVKAESILIERLVTLAEEKNISVWVTGQTFSFFDDCVTKLTK